MRLVLCLSIVLLAGCEKKQAAIQPLCNPKTIVAENQATVQSINKAVREWTPK